MPEANKISLKPLFIALFVGLALVTGYVIFKNQFGGQVVNSFEDCVKAGNPVMESYPEQCRSGKQTFINTDQITQ